MWEVVMAHEGRAFITHEFDEAIAVQEAIVECGRQLADVHPVPDAKRSLKQGVRQDERLLKDLRKLGQKYDATGKREEIAAAMEQLARETAQSAKGGEEAEVYEATAVLVSLKRKQQDAAASIQKIARKLRDTEMRDAAGEFRKAMKQSSDELVKQLGELAVQIATKDGAGEARSASRRSGRQPTR
jgi:hypothetical protein